MDHFNKCVFSVVFVQSITLAWCGYEDFYRLKQDKLTNYSKSIIPTMDSSPISLTIALNLKSINAFDDVEGTMTSVGSVRFEWVDEKITWNLADYNFSRYLTLSLTEIWSPPIYIINTAGNLKLQYDAATTTAMILDDGEVSLEIGQIFKTVCDIDITYYPMDRHTCGLELSTLTEEWKISTSFEFETSSLTQNSQWEVLSTSTHMKTDTDNNVHTHIAKLILKRRSKFLVVTVIFPVIYLGIINLFVFVMPPESGERVSFSMTVLLSFAVFLTIATDKLPDSGNTTPVFCVYIATMLIYSGAITLANIIILLLYHREPYETNKHLSSRCHSLRRIIPAKQKISIETQSEKTTFDMALPEKDGTSLNGDSSAKSENKDICNKLLCKRVDTICLITFAITHVLASMIFIIVVSCSS